MMCKFDVVFCGGPKEHEHIMAMIACLYDAAESDEDADEEWGPDSAAQQLERGPR